VFSDGKIYRSQAAVVFYDAGIVAGDVLAKVAKRYLSYTAIFKNTETVLLDSDTFLY